MAARCLWCVSHVIEILPSNVLFEHRIKTYCYRTKEEHSMSYICDDFEWHPSFAFMAGADGSPPHSVVNKVVIV